jgi:16S rRNA (cytosine967-C5)-methyltransferase
MKHAATLAAELAAAATVVAAVARGRSLSQEAGRFADSQGDDWRAALIDLTHGTLRCYGRVQATVMALSHQRPQPLVEALLWCALYALDSGRHRTATVVDEAVKACVVLEHWTAKPYVNALLRRFLREGAAVQARLERDPVARYQHPAWWIDLLRVAYPAAWEAILAAGNGRSPMCLRVNRRRADIEDYRERLAQQGRMARRCGPQALLLEHPLAVERLPGFAEGEVSIQDRAAQRAAECLDLHDGQRVLDACAAPGGKTAHMLELADVEATALDIDAARAKRIVAGLGRLGLHAEVQVADAADTAQWWDGRAFERVLLDAPCSASGVVRRHPDVKWLRRERDLTLFAERQRALLGALWRVLAPGGKLLYATCSVFPQENEHVIEAFMVAERGARRLALPDAAPGQSLPAQEHDGFYYALIEKHAGT